jgi:hypothetical protein
MKIFAALTLALATSAAIASGDAATSIAAGLAAAAREQRPLLLDFQAQWCYSCYFMAKHVLTGPQWDRAGRRARVLEVDGDSPDGAHWMEKLAVKALPSYVVLKADGSELGRIVGEQPREKFYTALEKILAGADALDVLKAAAANGSVAATASVLASYQARDAFDEGLDWYATLPAASRAAADVDAQAALWRERLRMQKALRAQDRGACVASARKVLAGPVGCDRYYVLEGLLDCSDKLPADERKTLLRAQRPALEALLDKQVFVAAPTCADQRSATLVGADLAKAIGDAAAEKAVLDRAIAYAHATLHEDYAKDRNLADNLRVYLQRAGRMDEHDALLPKLIAAYPDDYVYAYRYGRSLLERGQPAQALSFLEQAAAKTFGANRLTVAELRAKALLALHRRSDAEKVVADALQQNGPWFPEAAAKLKAVLKS